MSAKQPGAYLHSGFYRDCYRKLLRWLVISVVVILLLVVVLIYLLFSQAPTHYYANTVEGKILPIQQLSPTI